MPAEKSPFAKQLEEVRELTKKRAAAPANRLLELLRGEGVGDTRHARDLRREIYSALSWIETDDIRDVLLAALQGEHDDVADSIGYVLWRQEALMAELPARIDAAVAAGDQAFAGRLLSALVRGDDERKHRKWVFANHRDLFRKTGVEYD
jgi:hypothetical protein